MNNDSLEASYDSDAEIMIVRSNLKTRGENKNKKKENTEHTHCF